MGITNDKALQLQKEIELFCLKHDLWLTVEQTLKPDLKMIRAEISIKVDGGTSYAALNSD